MSLPARPANFPDDDKPSALVRHAAKPGPGNLLSKPVILNVDAADRALASADAHLKLVDSGAPKGRKRTSAVVTGLRDLQQLQKQTIAVLEAVKGNLEDIRQVLRSPEATRGMEKQQNAAALLAKGFPAEASGQARGAVELLPANPEAHLLLSLSLAANQEFDESLATARKGLALFDRRQHPLAIEAGLLHAIAALGHGGEAAQRWHEIIESLPLPVLCDHIARIAVCYPSHAPEAQLDRALARRIKAEPAGKPADLPPASLFSGLDAAQDHTLARTHRALMLRVTAIARRLVEPAEVLRFLGDYVVPLSERDLNRSARALAQQAVKVLLEAHADAPTLHRALLKLELAGPSRPAVYLARLLAHWRAVGARARQMRLALALSSLVFFAGAAVFGHAAARLSYLPAGPWGAVAGHPVEPLHAGLAVMAVGAALALATLFRRSVVIDLPCNRRGLRHDEIRFLRTREVKDTFRRVLRKAAAQRS